MTMTDPVADMLTRLRNANSAHHDTVSMPHSQAQGAHRRDPQARGLHLRLGGHRRARRPDPDARASSSARTASVRSPASSASRSPAFAFTRSRPRSPRFSAASASPSCPPPPVCSPTARPRRRAWVGKSSPTCGNPPCHVLDDCPSTSPPASTVTIDGPGCRRQGPEGRARAHRRQPDRGQDRGEPGSRHPSRRRARIAFAARPDPHADQQPDHRRHPGLLQGPRDRRHGLPRRAEGQRGRVRPRLLAPRHRRAARGHHLHGRGQQQAHRRGIDKQAVGEVAANIRKIRKPEPYKGKGMRYAGEVVRRKAGKAGK